MQLCSIVEIYKLSKVLSGDLRVPPSSPLETKEDNNEKQANETTLSKLLDISAAPHKEVLLQYLHV